MVFRYLLRNWLQRTAREKVRETVVEAAREHVQSAADKPQPTPDESDEPCHVGVVFALGIEAGGLEDLLRGKVTTRGHGFTVRQGSLRGRRVAVVLSGAGRENAARATEALIVGHHPQWVLSTGFAGGLSPELKPQDVLMVDHLVDTSGARLAIDLKVDPDWVATASGVHVGRLLTADRLIRLPDEKRSLREQYDALAVDMETFAVAEVCRRHRVRFLAVRAITDGADEELPPDVRKLLAQKTKTARLGAAAGAIWRRPSSFKDMVRLRETALLASDRLAKFLAGMIEQL